MNEEIKECAQAAVEALCLCMLFSVVLIDERVFISVNLG